MFAMFACVVIGHSDYRLVLAFCETPTIKNH